MSRTGQQLLTDFSDFIGDSWSSTSDGAGAADGSTIVDSLVQRWGRDSVQDGFFRVTEGANLYAVRRATNLSGSTITLSPAFGAQVISGIDYEFHRYDPVRKFSALDRARIHAYPQLAIVTFDDSITADGDSTDFLIPSSIRKGPVQVYEESRLVPNDPQNLLSNPQHDVLTNWTAATLTATLHTKNTYDKIIPKWGEQTCTKTTGSGTHKQAVSAMSGVTAASAAGRRMTYGRWVFCVTANSVRPLIEDDSGITYGDYHAGNGWEFIQVTDTVSLTNTTTLNVGVDIATADTVAYHQDSKFRFGNKVFLPYRKLLPKRGLRHDDGDAEVYLVRRPSAGYQLRLVGRTPLSALGTVAATQVTNTMEVDQFSQQLLFAKAARILFTEEGMTTGHIETEYPQIQEAERVFTELQEDWSYNLPFSTSVDGWWSD